MLKICWSTAWFASFEWAGWTGPVKQMSRQIFWQNMCKHLTGLCKCSLSAQAVNPLNHSFYSCLRIPNIQGLVKRQVNFVWVTNQSWTSHQIGACCCRTTGKNGCNASCFWLYGFHLNRAFSQHQNTASFSSLSIARHFLHKSGGIELSTIWNRRKDRNTYLWKLIYSEFHIWWESMICHATQGCQIRVDICVIR